ncbi:hypothetical protein K8R04_02110 [Candidatus Uhrbacteria bacterium]|nr:hypothetical protein [Candidatus Uhrbacteria bacterium]
MPSRDKEFRAFLKAKLDPLPEKRQEAITKINRRGLLMRLVRETDFPDSRLGAMKRLDTFDLRKASPEEKAFYLKIALNENVTEIRLIAAKRIDSADRDKLTGSAFADVRLMVALNTSSRDTLLRLLLDPDTAVKTMAEKSLRKNGLQESSRPYSVN